MKKRMKNLKKVLDLKYLWIFVIITSVLFMFIILTPTTESWTKEGNVYNCSSCSDCNSAITNASAGDIVQLNTSINDHVGTCIDFNGKDNIIFDCLGNTIDGVGYQQYDGIYMTNATGDIYVNNSIVKNCNVREFNRGIYLLGSNNTLINITSNSNYRGIDISSFNSTFTSITTGENSQYGIRIANNNNNLTNINASNNGCFQAMDCSGIYLSGSNNTLINITANNNTYYGIYSSGGSDNIITNSTVQENSKYDIYIPASSTSMCRNNFTNITGSGDRPIEFYNYNATIQNKILSELFLCNADNSIVNNITIRGSDIKKNNGLYITLTDNSTISNINSSGNYYGINVEYSSINNTLINITTDYNLKSGIYFQQGRNSILTNIQSNNHTGSWQGGIYISGGSANNNIIINATLKFNYIGIFIVNNNLNNTIKNSRIERNTQNGIRLEQGIGGYPQNNTFYNNIINNTDNYHNLSALTNYFNTTLTSGTNIVGGPYIGGNFWAYPNGTGFSETCTDSDSDGICDSSYNIENSGNYDYLPLASYTESTNGETNGGTTDGGDGDGGGGGATSPSETSPTQTHSWTEINPEQPATMTITHEEIDLTKITINVKETISDASLTVTKVDVSEADLGVGLPIGIVYQAFNITTNINETNIANITIGFKINKTWLLEQNGTFNDITLYRKTENIWNPWQALNTTLIEEDADFYYFSALSPGFSTFVIFLETTYKCTVGEKRCFNNEVQLCLGNYSWMVIEKCKYECKVNRCIPPPLSYEKGLLSFYIIAGLIIGGVAYLVYYIYRNLRRKRFEGGY